MPLTYHTILLIRSAAFIFCIALNCQYQLVKMGRAENQEFAKRVVHYYENTAKFSKSGTAHHFQLEGRHREVIYHIIKRYEERGTAQYQEHNTRRYTQEGLKKVGKVKKVFEQNPSISVRVAARKLNVPTSTVSYIKTKTLGIRCFSKKMVPKYVKDQEQRAKTRSRKDYDSTAGKVIIMDDETYLPFDPADRPGKQVFHATGPKEVPYKDRTVPRAKFYKKFLIWQAIDETGNVSRPFICDTSMNSDVYLNECIKKRLLPFIDQHHSRDKVVFWPDLAPIHYTK